MSRSKIVDMSKMTPEEQKAAMASHAGAPKAKGGTATIGAQGPQMPMARGMPDVTSASSG